MRIDKGFRGALTNIMATFSLFPLIFLICTFEVIHLGAAQEYTNPRIIGHPQDQFVLEHDPVTLDCETESIPPAIITWYKDGRRVITNSENPSSNLVLLPSGQLFLLSVMRDNWRDESDVGVYYCNATNPATGVSVKSRNATLQIAYIQRHFVEPPRDTTVARGDDAIFGCLAPLGEPDPVISWRKDGASVVMGGRISIDALTLRIENVDPSDAGLYTCVATNIIGVRHSEPASLTVLERPVFVETPSDVVAMESDRVMFRCQAEGVPLPTISWRRDGAVIPEDRTHIEAASLEIIDLQITDSGTYTCTAENSVGYVETSFNLTVERVPRHLLEVPRNTTVAKGNDVIMRCRGPPGNREPLISWMKDGEIFAMGGRVTMNCSGSLLIEDIEVGDAGIYLCISTDDVGVVESEPAFLSVFKQPAFVVEPSGDVIVQEGEIFMMTYQVEGVPTPTIRWTKDGAEMPEGRLDIQPNVLKFMDLRVEDTGVYTCRAENSLGFVEASFTLRVQFAPRFLEIPQDSVAYVGRRLILECEVSGNPEPTIFWSKGSSHVLMFPNQDHGRMMVLENGTFIIDPVLKEDEGNYTCQAINVLGAASATSRLQVKDEAVDLHLPPIIDHVPQNQIAPTNGTALIECSSSSEPQPIISWLKVVPASPLHLVDLSDPRFTQLETGTLQITELRITDEALYECKVTNANGETSWKASLTVEDPDNPNVIFQSTPDHVTFPGPPSRPNVRVLSANSMNVTWHANSSHGASAIRSFRVEYFKPNTSEQIYTWILASDSIVEEHYVVENLEPNTSYVFLVRAKNHHGLSLPSQVTEPYTTKPTESITEPTESSPDPIYTSPQPNETEPSPKSSPEHSPEPIPIPTSDDTALCFSNPCLNGATFHFSRETGCLSCACANGYDGMYCENDE